MSHYHHLSIEEREKILLLFVAKNSMRTIAAVIGRSASTISREISRNIDKNKGYSAVLAEKRYRRLRKKSKRCRLLDIPERRSLILKLFLEWQWSPEEMDNRLRVENNSLRVSYSTIYRAIYAGMLDPPCLSHGSRGVARKLRHRGKTRHTKGNPETRGKIVITNRIADRPEEATSRMVIGHWEADTVAGKTGSACLVTIVDRCSRYLLAGKTAKKYSALVAQKMIDLLLDVSNDRKKSITPDRGMEFAKHGLVSAALDGVQFYFPDPHAPWQRGTNENTNGLLREYLPKSFDMAACSDADIAAFVTKLNRRPRKCLDWKSPFEVFFNQSLQLT
jgi:transposase, IS30 family